MEFAIVESEFAGHVVVAVHGELDAATAPALRERVIEILDAGARRLVLDLQPLTFLDSSGLSALVASRHAANAAAATFALVTTRPATQKVFQITQLDQVFDIHSSVEAATAS